MIDLHALDGSIQVSVNEWTRPLREWRDVEQDLRDNGKSTKDLRAKVLRDLRRNGHLPRAPRR